MSVEWFRSYHGAPTDPKWRVIARKAGCRPGDVAAIVWALFDIASQATERGVTHCDARERNSRCEEISAAFDFDLTLVEAVYGALEERQIIIDGRFKAWEKRQPKREDNSMERTRAFRERMRTQRDASVTHGDARVDKSREEKNPPIVPRKRGMDAETRKRFDAWYAIYPRHVARSPAEHAFAKALQIVPFETLMTGARRYSETCRGRDPDKIAHPATWLNQRRWEDEPAKPTATETPLLGTGERSPVVWRNRLAQWLSGASWLRSWDIADCPRELLTEFAERLRTKPPPGWKP